MIFNLNHEGKAVNGPSGLWSVGYADLRNKVEFEKTRLSLEVGSLRAQEIVMSKDLASLSRLLACLDLRVPVALFSPDWSGAECVARQSAIRDEVHSETALILFTSGSSGVPKAVQLSQKNIASNLTAVLDSLRLHKEQVQHLFLDLSYSFGLLGQLLPGIHCGHEINLYNSVLELKDLLESGGLRGMVSGVPSQLKMLATLTGGMKNPFVTGIVSAGAFLPYELRTQLKGLFPNARITSNYGQTEASPRILSYGSEDPLFFLKGVGRTVRGISARLSESGELLVFGDQIMLGYLGDESVTREKVVEGWLHTGDLAEIDDTGLVSIRGRSDDQLKIAGERISPLEVEKAVCTEFAVTECLVFGIDGPNGEVFLGLAFLEQDEGQLQDLTHVRARLGLILSKQKVPKQIFIAPEFPKTSNGKLARSEVKKHVLNWRKK